MHTIFNCDLSNFLFKGIFKQTKFWIFFEKYEFCVSYISKTSKFEKKKPKVLCISRLSLTKNKTS